MKTIRQARPEDAAAIAAIWAPIIRDTQITFTTDLKSPGTVAAEIQLKGPAFLVAETRKVVIGFASYGPFRSGPGYAMTQEHSIQLAPNARGAGIGRALMSELFEVARQNRITALIAGISGANPGAVAFHSRLGFNTVGRLPGVGYKFGDRLDLIFMQKNLSPTPDTVIDTE